VDVFPLTIKLNSPGNTLISSSKTCLYLGFRKVANLYLLSLCNLVSRVITFFSNSCFKFLTSEHGGCKLLKCEVRHVINGIKDEMKSSELLLLLHDQKVFFVRHCQNLRIFSYVNGF
jgi:hypothetical protein